MIKVFVFKNKRGGIKKRLGRNEPEVLYKRRHATFMIKNHKATYGKYTVQVAYLMFPLG